LIPSKTYLPKKTKMLTINTAKTPIGESLVFKVLRGDTLIGVISRTPDTLCPQFKGLALLTLEELVQITNFIKEHCNAPEQI
jgi:hypothetical protein